jgi:hypothetical protein
MDTANNGNTTGTGTGSKRIKMVQISLTFQADTDAEALTVKQHVCDAVTDHPEINIAFGIQERTMPAR